MRSEAEIKKFLEEIYVEITYIEEKDDQQEMPYWTGIRDTLLWILGADDFVFREMLEANKDG